MMRRPLVLLCAEDGLAHMVEFLDAVYWRPQCSIEPRKKPKGWKKQSDDQPLTCLPCLVGVPERWFMP